MKRDYLWNLLFPQGIYCVICGKYINDTRRYSLCDHCIKRMKFEQTIIDCGTNFDFAMASMGYGIYERRLIFNLKYDGKTYLSRVIADILYDSIFDMIAKGDNCPICKGDLIIPVPIHEKRLKERGFNQSEKIALHLGKKLNMPVAKNILIRIKNTDAQRALSAEARENNMRDAFAINERVGNIITGKKIVLLDDIYTTGATARACGEMLSKYNPEKIFYLSLLFAGNRHHLMVE